MTANNTQCGSTTVLRSGEGTIHVVLVADDPAVTEEAADILGDGYLVRAAHTRGELLSALDGEVSAVLVDPALADAGAMLDRLATGIDCRVAALVGDRETVDERFDGVVHKPLSRSALRATVDRLCRCVAYSDALDRYFDFARTLASLPADDPQRDRLAARLDALKAELDETATPLDSDDIYDAALRER